MKANYLISCLLVLAMAIVGHAQSVYHFQYSFHRPADSVSYQAFFVRYDDGTGLLRVRYTLPGMADDMVVETDTQEDYVTDSITGKTDTTVLYLRAANPRFIIGNSQTSFNLPTFLFGYNAATGFYEPTGVINTSAYARMAATTSFNAALVEGASLNKSFVAAFFGPDEDFYTSLFNSQTKGLTPAEKNTKLYLLVVADTLDESIGASCSLDLSRAIETFKGVTDYLGIPFVPKTIAGPNYSKRSVQLAVAALKPAPNDIVVFYYTGHGFRKQEENRRFPNVKLKTFHTDLKDVLNNSLNIEDIFSDIKKKGARFNLVLSDCCNSDIEITNISGSKPGKTKGSGVAWNEDNCRSLFLNKTPMSILATAADNGQRATSNNNFGGFFSFYFKTCMESYCSKLKTSASWDLILQDAQAQTINKAKHTYCDKPYIPTNICNQYPYYIIR